MNGEDYEAGKPVPARTPAYGDPWQRGHDPLCPWDETSGSSEGLSKYACECALVARVRQDMASQYLVSDREQQEAEQRAYAKGRADALAEARDAVAALPVAITVVHDTPFLNKQGMGVCENPDDYPHGIVQVAALAAIDALRGERA